MANPQKENGYSGIANELMEAFSRIQLTGQESRLVFHIIRNTYGYNRKEYTASLSAIGKEIKLNRVHVKRAVDGLLSKMVIAVTKNGNRAPLTYRINKNYDQWCYQKWVQSTVTKNGNNIVPKNGNSENVLPIIRKQIKQKEIKKKKKPASQSILKTFSYPSWLDKKLWSEFCHMRSRIRKPITSELAITRLLNSLKKIMDQGYTQEDVIGCALEKCWQSFFEPKNYTGEQSDAERDRIFQQLLKES